MGDANNIDIEYALVTGSPIKVKNIKVYPLTLKEIGEIGYGKYQQLLSSLLVTKEMLVDNIPEKHYDKIDDYDIVVSNCVVSKEHRDIVEAALSMVTRELVVFHEDYHFFVYGDITKEDTDYQIIDRDVFLQIAEVVRKQNLIERPKKKKRKTKESKKIQELRAKMEKGRKHLAKAKNQKTTITIVDLISIVSTYTGDFQSTVNWTIYQLNLAHVNFLKKENYRERFDVYLAGGDPKKLKLDTHWSKEK